MPKTIISEGKTTTEAIEKGLRELNASKSQVNIKVMEEKKKSFFNILAPHLVKVELTLKENVETRTENREKEYAVVDEEVLKKAEILKYF